MRLTTLTLIAMLALVVSPRATDELAVLASGATEGTLRTLAPDLTRAGLHPTFAFETSQTIAQRLAAGDLPDVLVAQTAAVDQVIKDGAADASSRAALGRIAIGVAVSSGVAPPNPSTIDALKAAILNADTIVVSQGASGTHVEKALATLGLTDRIAGRLIRERRGDDVMRRLASSGNAIGFTMISEIKFGESHGAKYAGPLPAALQAYNSFDAVVMTRTRNPQAARAFVKAIGGREAQKVFARFGWERR
jgi:molybdate transport system substrate-binding protein